MGQNFHKLVDFVDYSLVPPKDTTHPNFAEKTFMSNCKTGVSHYTLSDLFISGLHMYIMCCIVLVCYINGLV